MVTEAPTRKEESIETTSDGLSELFEHARTQRAAQQAVERARQGVLDLYSRSHRTPPEDQEGIRNWSKDISPMDDPAVSESIDKYTVDLLGPPIAEAFIIPDGIHIQRLDMLSQM